MRSVDAFGDGMLIHAVPPLAAACLVGLLLGLEREISHKPAGLRTQVLITVGTVIFVLVSRALGNEVAGRVAANVLTGLGFLGAGVILQHHGSVRGLTTSALIWVNGSLGMAIGFEKYALAGIGTALILLALRLLLQLEKQMGLKCRVARYQLTSIKDESDVLRIIDEELKRSHFQDEALTLDKQGDVIIMRFAFCNPPARHQQFAEKMRQMPNVISFKQE